MSEDIKYYMKINIEGREIEGEIIDYSIKMFTVKPHSVQLIKAFQFNKSIKINNRYYRIVEIIKQEQLLHVHVEEVDE